MTEETLAQRIKTLGARLQAELSAVDAYELEAPERKLVQSVKRDIVDLRLDIRDYEFADTRADQQKASRLANRRLDKLQTSIVALGQHGLFGAADVAEYGARLEAIAKEL